MYRHLGHHYVKKYNHTLIINTVYQEPKPSRESQVFTSTSSRPSRDMSINKNVEQIKKRQRNYLFSPQISLERYRSKGKCEHTQKTRPRGESDIKLIISTMNQNRSQIRRSESPFRQMNRQSTFCSHCSNREKHNQEKKQKKIIEQQNGNKLQPLFKDTKMNVKIIETPALEYGDRLFSSLRGSNKKSVQEGKKQFLQLPVEVKPWEMTASDSSI